MTMIAKHYSGTAVSDVPQGTSAVALPSGFHILAGQYVLNGTAYDCRAGGLYRFYDPQTLICEQRLSWSNPQSDVYPYLSGLSWAHADGPRDAALSLANKQTLMKNHIIEMQCGDIALLCMSLLGQFANPTFQTRQVQVLTAGPLISGDNGHLIFEVKIDGAWRLFDVTNGRYFTDEAGNHLNLKQIIEIGMPNCNHVRISDKIVGTGRSGSYSNYFYYAFVGKSEADTIAWCERIYQIPIVGTTANMPLGTEARQSWVQGLGFSVASKAAWDSTYYPAA